MVDSLPRVLIVDDQEAFARLFAERLMQDERLVLLGIAGTVEEAHDFIGRLHPDLIFLEVSLPGCSPYSVLRTFCETEEPAPAVALLSSFCSPFLLRRALLRDHVRGYLLKHDPPAELLRRAGRLVRGEPSFSPAIERQLKLDPLCGRLKVEDPSRLSELTDWQLEMLQQLVSGSGVKEMARRERLSYKSVDSFQYRMLCKLGIRNRMELIRLAIREGLTTP